LAQRFQRAPSEFRQFVEKQDSEVCQANLARPRHVTATNERSFTD
jgi:hypothetical protein